MSQARFQKQQREKARREKAAAKWERREERREAKPSDAEPLTAADEAAVLAALAALHEQFDAGTVTFDDFSVARDELVARLVQ